MTLDELTYTVLEIIDNSDNGVPLTKLEEVMMMAVNFSSLFTVINILWNHKLIWIDTQSVAHRVRS